MSKLSIIIPSFNEPYLGKTVRDLLNKAKGNIEIFVNVDGDMPKKLVKDKRVTYTHHQEPIGMRGGTNLALKKTKSKFIMKTDAHCVFAKGFDEVLKRDCKENWLMIPRRYSLNQVEWDRSLKSPVKDYHYYTYPNKKTGFGMPCPVWPQMTRKKMNDPKYDIDDTMAFQGSCWFAHRDYFMKRVGFLDDGPDKYTPYSGEQLETGLKYWLTDGEVKVNKKTWYAHLLKTGNYYKAWKLSRKVKTSRLTWKGHRWAAKHWLNNEEPGMKHKFQWLVEKFWPVPNWPENRKLWKFSTKEDVTETPLCKLAYKYGTDKCPKLRRHEYTPYYYKLFKNKRNSINKVLEMGIGLKNGASLKMWRDFFPNALIYGADNNPLAIVQGKRIKSYLCDLTKEEDIKQLVKKVGSDVDIFVDDGNHIRNHQVYLARTILPLLKDDVIYIIEDIFYPDYIKTHLRNYKCEVIEFNKKRRADRLIVVKKKKRDLSKMNNISFIAKLPWLLEMFWSVLGWPEDKKLWYNNTHVDNFSFNLPTSHKVINLNPTKETPLCKLAYKYGTDKCSKYKHPYTPYYHKLFSRDRKNVKKLLELGIGYPGCMRHVKNYRRGASLKMWRDFFPNARIYGADIRPDTMFEEDRIKTFLCDERKKDDLVKLVKSVGPDVDIFIDDGIHEEDDQIFMCLTLMPFFRSGVIYIIEDVEDYKKVMDALAEYDCEVVHLPKSRISRTHRDLVMVKHKIKETPLCKLAYKYGTDKCPKIKHNFTPYYYSLFRSMRKSVKLVFEMGIGFYNNIQKIDKIYDPNLKRWYHRGASLKMWRDFFPNAQIIGVDTRPITQFEGKRIKTYICDESDTRNIRKLIKKFGERIDIFIDDASHDVNLQVLLAKTTLPLLRKDVIYIIEDVIYPKYIYEQLKKYDCEVIKCSKRWRDDHLVVVRRK
jgi:hypothetical protein